jgi:regulator of replication initiation timing
MRKSEMTPDALPHHGAAAPFRVAVGLAVAASAGVMLWGVGTQCVLASEFGRNAAGENRGSTRYPVVAYLSVSASEFGRNVSAETPMTLEDSVAALTAELAQVKAETTKLRESQSDASKEFSHLRASLINAEIGLAELRTTTEENEAHRRDTAAQVASNVAQLKDETLHLRMAQDDTATDIGSLRAGLANTEIGADSLRATTWQISQQIERIEAGRDATGSIAKRHKHQGHKKWTRVATSRSGAATPNRAMLLSATRSAEH